MIGTVGTVGVILAILAFLLREAVRKNWVFVGDRSHVDFNNDAKYQVLPVPITYYKKGDLAKLIPKWHGDKSNSYLHVYRLDPSEKPFDFAWQHLNTSTLAKTRQACTYDESVLCNPCFTFSHETINTYDLLNSKEGSPLYASFAQLEDMGQVQEMWNELNLPGIDIRACNFEHAFISNFNESIITAPIHANPITSSLGVQFVGEKSWIFFPPDVYLDKDKMDAFPANAVRLPTQSPKVPYNLYLYKSRPGDLFFFSTNWAHIVFTHKGPNFLMNFRQLEAGNILHSPLDWVHALVEGRITKRVGKRGKKLVVTPYTPYLESTLNKIGKTCPIGGTNSPWDREMIKLLKEFAAKE